jgi:hypothetical protein
MKRVMQPFRAPRSGGDKTQERVHRKDNNARFKEMERWMDKNLTGEGVGVKTTEVIETSPAKKRQVKKQSQVKDKEVHAIPYKKGLKTMSEREADECAQYGEVLRWSTDSEEDVYPQPAMESVVREASDSEEPTEFGVVWERFIIQETDGMDGRDPDTRLEITTRSKDPVGISASNITSPVAAEPIAMDAVSPCLSAFESDGFMSRRKAISKRAKAKIGIFGRAKSKKKATSDNSDDDLPVSSLLKRKLPSSSEDENDAVPIASLVVSKKLDVLAEVNSTTFVTTGEACVGVSVARDFGPPHGVCLGSIVRVDVHRRRPLYHVVYGDGDEEDYDEGEFQYARELFVAHSRGETLPAIANEQSGITCMLLLFFNFYLTYILVALQADPVRRMKPASMEHQIVKVLARWQKLLVGRSSNAL